jgi:fluoride exporter
LISFLLVGVGGALGAMARHFVAMRLVGRSRSWPWGTFVINVSGCLMIAFFLTLAAGKLAASSGWRHFFPIGFVGAYTTFSTFEYDTLRLLERRAWLGAVAYITASTVAGFGGVLLAVWLSR